MTDNEMIFESIFGFQVPYSPASLSVGTKSLDMNQFGNLLKEKDDLYDPEDCYHLEMGGISLMDYVYQKYGEAAANLIEELV